MVQNLPYINKDILEAGESGDWFGTTFAALESLAQFAGRLQLPFSIQAPADNQPYVILPNTRFAGTVKSIVLWTDAGTLIINAKINNTNITGLNAIAVTSTRATTNASGANLMIANNDLIITPSSVINVNWLYGNVAFDRTGAGTA